MLKYILFLFFSILSIRSANSESFEYNTEKMMYNLNSFASGNNLIIIGGQYGCILLSKDNGLTWEQKKIADDSFDLIQVKFYEGNFYVLANKNFILKSSDGVAWEKIPLSNNLVNKAFSISGNSIYVLHDKIIYKYYEDKIDSLSIFGNSFNEFFIYQNKLIFSFSGNIYFYDLNSMILDSIDINGEGSFSYGFMIHNDYLFSFINDFIYKVNLDTKTTDKQFKIFPGFMLSHNNKIYCLNSFDRVYGYMKMIRFYSYDGAGKQLLINDTTEKTRFAYYWIKDVKHIDDNTILAVGTNKTIILSENNGKNWRFISNVDCDSASSFNAHNGIITRFSSKKHFRSFNGGITWLPEYYDTNFHSSDKIKYLPLTLYGNISDNFQTALLFDFHKSTIFTENNLNASYTDDFGETYKYFYIREMLSMGRRAHNMYKKDNSYFLNIAPSYKKGNFNYIFNDKFELVAEFYRRDFTIYKFIIDGNSFKAIAHIINPDSTYDIISLTSTDFGETWITNKNLIEDAQIFTINDTDERCLIKVKFTKDAKFKLYEYNLLSEELILVDAANWGYMGKIKDDKYLIIDEFSTLYSVDKGDTLGVNKKSINLNNSLFIHSFFVDNDTIWTLSVTGGRNIYQKHVPGTSVSTSENNKLTNYLSVTNSYPSPSVQYVKALVAWDNSCNINELELEAFDLLGNKVSIPEEFSISERSPYSAEISWNCSRVNPGAYFIHVSCADINRVVSVLVRR